MLGEEKGSMSSFPTPSSNRISRRNRPKRQRTQALNISLISGTISTTKRYRVPPERLQACYKKAVSSQFQHPRAKQRDLGIDSAGGSGERTQTLKTQSNQLRHRATKQKHSKNETLFNLFFNGRASAPRIIYFRTHQIFVKTKGG